MIELWLYERSLAVAYFWNAVLEVDDGNVRIDDQTSGWGERRGAFGRTAECGKMSKVGVMVEIRARKHLISPFW